MVTSISALVVLLAGLYLVALAVAAVFLPERTTRFLEAFAGSAFAHLLELSIRLLVGLAFLRYSPYMQFGEIFRIFGWVLVVTTLVLFAVPWRWHRRFAQSAVPMVTGRLWILAVGSLALGVFVLLSVVLGSGT